MLLLLPKYLEVLDNDSLFSIWIYILPKKGKVHPKVNQGRTVWNIPVGLWSLDRLTVIGEPLRQFKSRYFELSTKDCFPANIQFYLES